ncbi:MAG: hypothetical protein GY913_03890 [Proteobacteria bacterium]|nr:hypothetical protein [Pseudomonadota bacterium]MCP4916044.1 hypothetical protein [Pseudomonadota bacterium]
MKKDDVPQDGGAVYEGTLRRVTYAVGEDGYEPVKSIGWEAEIAATEVSREFDNERITEAWEAARSGATSPLPYHMAVARMDDPLLSVETGFWRLRIRWDKKALPNDSSRLRRYSDALGISVEALMSLPDAPELL